MVVEFWSFDGRDLFTPDVIAPLRLDRLAISKSHQRGSLAFCLRPSSPKSLGEHTCLQNPTESCAPFTPPTTGWTDTSPSRGFNRNNVTVFSSVGGVAGPCSRPATALASGGRCPVPTWVCERIAFAPSGLTAENEYSRGPP